MAPKPNVKKKAEAVTETNTEDITEVQNDTAVVDVAEKETNEIEATIEDNSDVEIEIENNTNVANTKVINFLKKLWIYIKQARLELLLIVGFIVVDIMTKYIVELNMTQGESGRVIVIPNFFSWHYTINTGAAWGFLNNWAGAMILFYIITPLSAIGFFAFLYYFRGKSKWARIPFAAIIAGTLGNFYDRVFYQGVRDFIRFDYFGGTIFGSPHFPIFNIADILLVVGVIIFAVWFIFFYKPPKPALVGPVYQPDWGKKEEETKNEE